MDIRFGGALLVLAALVQSTIACGTDEKEEETAKSEEALDVSCLRSARTRAEFEACLGASGGQSGAPSAGQSCSTSISCVNGVCKCGDGTVCQRDACQTQCRVCK